MPSRAMRLRTWSSAAFQAVRPDVPAQSVKELVALSHAPPGRLNYAAGASIFNLAMELFKTMAGVDIVHIPYKGGSEALADVIGGHVDMTFDNIPGELGAIHASVTVPPVHRWMLTQEERQPVPVTSADERVRS